MDSLPEEMWENILSYLPFRDKRSCCRLNKRLSSEAIKLLGRMSCVALEREPHILKYMDYLNDGGRLHKNIAISLQPNQLVNEEKYEEILKRLKPGLMMVELQLFDSYPRSAKIEIGPKNRVSDQMLEKVLNLCQNFQLKIIPWHSPEYILDFFASSSNLECLTTLKFVYFKNYKIHEKRMKLFRKILLSSPNICRLILAYSLNTVELPTEWPITYLAEIDKLEKIKTISIVTNAFPNIMVDSRLSLETLLFRVPVKLANVNTFNSSMESVIRHHQKTLEKLIMIFSFTGHAEGVPRAQLPEMDKLKKIHFISTECAERDGIMPALPQKFPPLLKTIVIEIPFRTTKAYEKQLKDIFRHQWETGESFPNVKLFVICENYKNRVTIGRRMEKKVLNMFPNAEIIVHHYLKGVKYFLLKTGERKNYKERKR